MKIILRILRESFSTLSTRIIWFIIIVSFISALLLITNAITLTNSFRSVLITSLSIMLPVMLNMLVLVLDIQIKCMKDEVEIKNKDTYLSLIKNVVSRIILLVLISLLLLVALIFPHLNFSTQTTLYSFVMPIGMIKTISKINNIVIVMLLIQFSVHLYLTFKQFYVTITHGIRYMN